MTHSWLLPRFLPSLLLPSDSTPLLTPPSCFVLPYSFLSASSPLSPPPTPHSPISLISPLISIRPSFSPYLFSPHFLFPHHPFPFHSLYFLLATSFTMLLLESFLLPSYSIVYNPVLSPSSSSPCLPPHLTVSRLQLPRFLHQTSLPLSLSLSTKSLLPCA